MEPLQITLKGHLTNSQLHHAFDKVEAELERSAVPCGLIVDCSSMTSYDMAARSTFVEWNKKWRGKISRVAIVTDKWLWHMVISVMAKAAGQSMKPFANLENAREWVQGEKSGE
jgi:hypothetical protein